MNEMTNPVAVVTAEYRKRLGMTYRSFAEALGEKLVNARVSHATVMNWEKGMTDPATDFLLICLVVYPRGDWRTQFAEACLAAKLPEVFDREKWSSGFSFLI